MVVDELIALLGYKINDDAPLRRFSASLDGVVAKAAAAGRVLGAMAAVAGTAVAGGMAALGKGVISTSAQFEKYLTTLETIEGSAEKAKQSLDWVADFATKTPFEVSELMEAFVKLKSYGLDPMNGTMTTLGDTASAMGKSLDQAVEAFADATTGEFERLKEFGIRAKQAGEQVTFTWNEGGKEISKTVKKTSTDIGKFLNETLGRKFNGAMVRQSKTWNGMVSNLSDAWTNFQRRIGDAGFFEAAKNKLADVLDALGRWADDGTLDRAARALSNGLTRMADVAGAVFGRIVQHTKWLIEWFSSLGVSTNTVLGILGALVAWAFPVVAAFTGIALAVDDLLTYFQGGESIIGSFIESLKGLFANQSWGDLGRLVAQGLMSGIKTAAGFLWDVLVGLFTGGDWGGVGNTIGSTIWNGLKAYFEFLNGFWSEIGEAAVRAFDEIGTRIGEALYNGLVKVGEKIKAFFASLVPDWASNLFSGGGVSKGSAPAGQQDLGFGPMRQRIVMPEQTAPKIMPEQIKNAQNNLTKMQSGAQAPNILNDNSQDNRQFPVTVNAPVTVNVQQATQAPGAVGQAVSGAVAAGVKSQPARMQSGPSE